MCHSRNLGVHQWDQILPEAILYSNNTVNASSKFSPFEIAYGTSANTVLDNKLGVNGNREPIDEELVRQNVLSNKAEASQAYRKQANKVTKINNYNNGDLVLLKRIHFGLDHIKLKRSLAQ